jgi:membrane-associated phospholipid phosphatase
VLAVIYLVVLATVSIVWRFPASRDRVVLFVLAALIIAVIGRPHALARMARDFFPVVAFLYAYDLLRGRADGIVGHVFFTPQLRVDEWLFGGTAPTVTLQHDLWTAGHPHVWDYVAFLVYLTYFLLPFTVAAVLWRYRYELFHRYVSLWIGLSFAALVTYAVFPAAPPWMADEKGLLPHVIRITPYMTKHVGVNLARVMGSQNYVNRVAAVPSLHAGTALLISMFFWSRTKRWRWLLALYPLAMGFSLVYMGEHYVSDILLGWIYAVLIFVVGNRVYDHVAARHAQWSAKTAFVDEPVKVDAPTGAAPQPPGEERSR